MSIPELIHAFDNQRVLVVGDVMIDAYIWGINTRMSPEAPVPVVDVQQREARLGGAANVALNILGAGAHPMILTVLGDKGRSEEFCALMESQGLSKSGLVLSEERRCTVKTRVISNDKHMLRVDEEDLHPLSVSEEAQLLERFDDLMSAGEIDVVILQDYNKGVLTPTVIETVMHKSQEKGIKVLVDPKKDNFLAYKGCTLFKPNLKELKEGLKLAEVEVSKERLDKAVGQLKELMPHVHTLITLSEQGVYWHDGQESDIIPVFERNIVDVSGAGDTVIALAAVAMAAGATIPQASLIADLGGGLVCEKVGVQPIQKSWLIKEIESLNIS